MTKLAEASSRVLQAGILLLWLMVYLWLLEGERFLAYLVPMFRPLMIAAVVVLAVLIVARLVGGSPHRPALFALALHGAVLLLPVLYIARTYGQTLDAAAARTRSVSARLAAPVSARRPKPGPQKPPGGDVTILEIISDTERQVDHDVTTIGQVYQADEIPAGHFAVFRFMITCCAADAQPIAVLVETVDADKFAEDTWVQVTGRLVLIDVDGERVPCIRAAEIKAVDPPNNPYLF